jgi:hypothetical protein
VSKYVVGVFEIGKWGMIVHNRLSTSILFFRDVGLGMIIIYT